MACSSCGKSKRHVVTPDGELLTRREAIMERNKRQGYTKQTITIVGTKPITKSQIRAKNKSLLLG